MGPAPQHVRLVGAPRRRFLVSAAALLEDIVQLPPDQSHHLRVMRLQAGEQVTLLDGAGTEAVAEVLDAAAGRLRVTGRRTVAATPLRTCLVQALPVKLQRMDTVVQQATEIGLTRLVPVISERGKLPGGGEDSLARRHGRWLRLAAAAARQCGRATLPHIDLPLPLAELDLRQLPAPVLLLGAGGADMATAAVAGEVSLMVGPEGGWSDAEQRHLVAAGASVVGLGPRTLRADTAGMVALSVAQHLWGDLRGGAAAP